MWYNKNELCAMHKMYTKIRKEDKKVAQRKKQQWDRFKVLNRANQVFATIVIVIVAVMIFLNLPRREELKYVKMLEENQKHWSEVLSIIQDRKEAKTEAETSRAKIKELKEEALESSARIGQLLTETENLEQEAESKIDAFVPEEVEQLFLQANSNADLAAIECQNALEMIEEAEKDLEDIKQVLDIVTSGTMQAQEKRILLSTSVDEEILHMLQESEEALVVAKESSANLDQLVEEIEHLSMLTQEHWEAAKNFDVIQAIEELPENERNDVLLLSECIYHEAGICDKAEQYRVASVVMNRVKSDLYPNNLYDVIYDTKYATQYGSTGNFFTCKLPKSFYSISYDVYINGARNLPEKIIGQTGFKPDTSRYDIYMVSEWGHYYFSLKK